MEISGIVGIGAGDLQQATRAEARRILKDTKGDELAQLRQLLDRLREQGLVTAADVKSLQQLQRINSDAQAGKRSGQDAYFASRETFHAMLAGGAASPVALAIASSAVGSFAIEPGPDGAGAVAVAAARNRWSQTGATVGAAIGSIWGRDGATIGAAVGGAIGGAVDDCLE
jgi:hypothetical protein